MECLLGEEEKQRSHLEREKSDVNLQLTCKEMRPHQANSRLFLQPAERETQTFSAAAAEVQHIPTFQTASHINPMQQNVPQSVNPPSQSLSTSHHPPQPNYRPLYPCPAPNTFILYTLHFDHQLTWVCFGCGNSLKPSGVIGNPPGDLVIVSIMQRQYFHTRSGNLYFHCCTRCVRSRQPVFDPLRQCMVPDAKEAS